MPEAFLQIYNFKKLKWSILSRWKESRTVLCNFPNSLSIPISKWCNWVISRGNDLSNGALSYQEDRNLNLPTSDSKSALMLRVSIIWKWEHFYRWIFSLSFLFNYDHVRAGNYKEFFPQKRLIKCNLMQFSCLGILLKKGKSRIHRFLLHTGDLWNSLI